MMSRLFLGIFAIFVGTALAACGGANETNDDASSPGGGSGDGDTTASDGGDAGSDGGSTNGDTGGSSNSGGDSSGSSGGSGGDSSATGGKSGDDGKNCDASTVTTDDDPGACPIGQIREVVDETWGECVPLMDCGCDNPGSQDQCGDGLSYICYQSRRCGDLLK